MTDAHVFGSGDLRPELLRAARFTDRGGLYDPAEVHTFLERIASAMEVMSAGDTESSLRAEFRRNAEIAQQVLDAGQSAAEQLRRQAAEDAHRILEETRTTTTELHQAVQNEIHSSRAQVEDVRAQFIADLRDLYDRIGASLYRFERAASEGPGISAPAVVPVAQDVAMVAPPAAEFPEVPSIEEPQSSGGFLDYGLEPEPAAPAEPGPAYENVGAMLSGPQNPLEDIQQLQSATDPFLVVEDEPLAPGEPLVDLSSDSWLVGGEEPQEELLEEGEGEDAFGAFQPASADPVADDARAEALIAGLGEVVDAAAGIGEEAPVEVEPEPAPTPMADFLAPAEEVHEEAPADPLPAQVVEPETVAVPEPVFETEQEPDTIVPESAVAPEASNDAMAIRQLILEAVSAGQSRETIAAYLRDQLGMMEPDALIDAALNAQ